MDRLVSITNRITVTLEYLDVGSLKLQQKFQMEEFASKIINIFGVRNTHESFLMGNKIVRQSIWDISSWRI